MPSDTRAVAVSKRDLVTMDFSAALDYYAPNFAAELPSHIPVERFKRTVITAVNQNPDLGRADRRSLFNACVKCAHDGLYPDGREAALVVFGGQVSYLPMIAGIRKRMRNSGEVLSATAEVVYRNDKFRFVKGENPHIEHEPPPLDQDRGDAVGAYAIIKLANGETLREIMTKADIERVRSVSRSGRSADSPWSKWWDEMARKSVMRRCAKQAPVDSELERLMARDDERPVEDQREIPPRPTLDQFIEIAAAEEDEVPAFEVTDLDGEVQAGDCGQATSSLAALLEEAERRGRDFVSGLWESNGDALRQIGEADADAADRLHSAYGAALSRLEERSKRQHQPPPSADRPAGPDPSPEMPDDPPPLGAPPAAINAASPEGRAEAGSGGAVLASGRLPPATSSVPVVEAVMRGTGPRRTMDVEATLKALVAAFLDLETFGSCSLFRTRNRATINMLPEDEREGFEIAAKAHEQQLVGEESNG